MDNVIDLTEKRKEKEQEEFRLRIRSIINSMERINSFMKIYNDFKDKSSNIGDDDDNSSKRTRRSRKNKG